MVPEWRMFIAIPLPDEVKQWIRYQMSQLEMNSEYKRVTDYRDYHITVQFLGDASSTRADEIAAGMQAAVVSQSPFQLQIKNWDTFGRKERPRVLWLDMDGEREQLHMLHQQVGVEMDKLGFSQEAREYHPHITTARQYQGEAAIEIEKLREQLGSDRPIWKVDKLVLYRTRLGHSPMYEVVGEAPFIAAKT